MNEQLLITCLPDGTYHVKETEDQESGDSDPAIDQTVKSVDEAMQLVQQFFSEEQSEAEGAEPADDSAAPMDAPADADPSEVWTAEANKRDPVSGLRK